MPKEFNNAKYVDERKNPFKHNDVCAIHVVCGVVASFSSLSEQTWLEQHTNGLDAELNGDRVSGFTNNRYDW